MAALNLSSLSNSGAAESLTAASVGGDSFPLNQAIILRFKNAGAGAITVTVTAQRTCNHGVLHNRTYVVPNDGVTFEALLSGTDIDRFSDANGRVQLTYTAAAGLSVGAVAARG